MSCVRSQSETRGNLRRQDNLRGKFVLGHKNFQLKISQLVVGRLFYVNSVYVYILIGVNNPDVSVDNT